MPYQARYSLWMVCLFFTFTSVCGAGDSKLKPQPVKPAKKASNLEISEKAMKATAIRVQSSKKAFAKPQGWPTNKAWRPLRHFGPFTDIGDTAQIQLHVNGNSVRWYFNNYYATCPDAQWHERYFRNDLPKNATPDPPTPRYKPGELRASDGMHDLLFELDRVELKSLFGGSVELIFQTRENYEFEFRKDDTIWDFESLRMSIYVTPIAEIFNTPNFITNQKPIGIVFQAKNPTAYTIANEQFLRKPDDNTMEGLQAALDEVQVSLLNSIGTNAIRFVHGLIHGQLQNKIGNSNKVKMVEITDGFIDVLTEPGTKMFSVALRLDPITLDTSDGLKNVTGTISGIHAYDSSPSNSDNPWVSREFAFGSGDSTLYASHGHFELDECDLLKEGFYAYVEVTGWYTGFIDAFFRDPRKDNMLTDVELDCGIIRQRANAGHWGTAYGPDSYTKILQDSDGEFGSITVKSRVSVYLR